MSKKSNNKNVVWKNAPDVKKKVLHLIKSLELTSIKPTSVHFLRSENSTARAYARIWGLSKVWQMSLKQKPSYIIEVISEKFDPLTDTEKEKVLIHELAHIPKNFSGSLLPHIRRRGKRNFHDRVDNLFKQLKKINY